MSRETLRLMKARYKRTCSHPKQEHHYLDFLDIATLVKRLDAAGIEIDPSSERHVAFMHRENVLYNGEIRGYLNNIMYSVVPLQVSFSKSGVIIPETKRLVLKHLPKEDPEHPLIIGIEEYSLEGTDDFFDYRHEDGFLCEFRYKRRLRDIKEIAKESLIRFLGGEISKSRQGCGDFNIPKPSSEMDFMP